MGHGPLGRMRKRPWVDGRQVAEGVGWRRARPSPGVRLTRSAAPAWSRDCLRAVTWRFASLLSHPNSRGPKDGGSFFVIPVSAASQICRFWLAVWRSQDAVNAKRQANFVRAGNGKPFFL